MLILAATGLLAQEGLKAEYYDGTQFDHYVATTYVDNIDFYWNQVPPVKGINPHECSVRYTGKLQSPKTGPVTFSARVDDGIRVWVGGVQVIDNWQLNDVGYSEGKVDMKADSVYDLKIEYFNALNEAELRLLWTLPSEEEQSWLMSWWYREEPVIVPAAYFTPPVEKIVEVAAPSLQPIAKPKPKPKPKRKPAPKPKPVKKKPVVIAPKKNKIDTIQQYIPKSVAFERAKTEILPVSYTQLDKLAEFLVRHPSRKVRIEGHTDNVGDMAKNLLLSKRRANAVAAYLIKKGVQPKQLSAEGFGGTRPLARTTGKKYHPENRRVEFVVE